MNASILYEDFDDPEKGLVTFPPAEACVLAASAVLDSLHRTIVFAELFAEHPTEQIRANWAKWACRLSIDAERLDRQLDNREAFNMLAEANSETILRYEHSAHSHTELAFELARHHLLLIAANNADVRMKSLTDGVLLLDEKELSSSGLESLRDALIDFNSHAYKIDYMQLHIDMEKELTRSQSLLTNYLPPNGRPDSGDTRKDKRHRRTHEQWDELYAEFESANEDDASLTETTFAESKDILPNTLTTAFRKVEERRQESRERQSEVRKRRE